MYILLDFALLCTERLVMMYTQGKQIHTHESGSGGGNGALLTTSPCAGQDSIWQHGNNQ